MGYSFAGPIASLEPNMEMDNNPPQIIDPPDRIYLVYGEIGYDAHHNECAEVTWSDHQAFNADVEYVRNSPDQIKAVHPRCGTCKHRRKIANTTNGTTEMACHCEKSGYYDYTVDPQMDYCRYHDPVEVGN